MARARNIKPGFFTHDELAELGPLTRLLFIGLWTVADRAGRLEDRPKRIKAEVLPYDDCDVDAMLSELDKSGFILRYQVGEVTAIQIVKWDKHQNPHIKESDSTIPAPEQHGADTVQDGKPAGMTEPPSTGVAGLIPDSGFPLPDSNSVPKGTAAKVAKRSPALRKPDDVTERTWMDWQQLRRAKRAPVTETVVDGARAESEKAGLSLEQFLQVWCRRGSQGLEAIWLKPEERGSGRGPASSSEPAWRTEQRQRTQLAAPGVAVQDAAQFFDVEASDVTPHRLG